MSIILGISDSHEAHACILVDGKVVCAVAEERITRLKADMGYPKNAIEAVLKISELTHEKLISSRSPGLKERPFMLFTK